MKMNRSYQGISHAVPGCTFGSDFGAWSPVASIRLQYCGETKRNWVANEKASEKGVYHRPRVKEKRKRVRRESFKKNEEDGMT